MTIFDNQVLALNPALFAQAAAPRIVSLANAGKRSRKPIRRGVPCAHERRGETSSAAVAAMNSRRFIRSSSQLEDDGAQSITFRWSSHSLRVQMLRRQCGTRQRDGYGSNSEVAAVASQVCSTPNNRHSPLERTRPFGANNGKDRACIATSGRSCALTAPTRCPMITNLEISPRTSTRNLCVRNFVQSHDRSKI